jgi:glycosyltransferase involved in cell wall biosynthesis
MAKPAIVELPIPSTSKTGWPWTESSPTLAVTRPDGSPWPRLSIVTPSYNQGQFLEETIRSVLMQGYPNLEFLVLDGSSQDNSLEILKKYSPFLSYWHSRKDKGQSDAINQGLRMATGDIVAWINSDDTYLSGVFERIVTQFDLRDTQVVYGRAYFIDEESKIVGEYPAGPIHSDWRRFRYWRGWPIPQPTVFLRRKLFEKFGYLDTALHYGLDYDLFIRLSCNLKFDYLDIPLANYRIHSHSKTGEWAKSQVFFYRETLRVNQRYAPWFLPENWRLWVEWFIHVSIRYVKKVLHPLVKWWKNE